MVAFKVEGNPDGDAGDLLAVYNANREAVEFTLPEGEWEIFVDDKKAGTEVLDTVSGKVGVAGISMIAAVKK